MSTITTITGWVGSNPTLSIGKSGTQFTTIRVATTNRFRNANQEWVDGETQWFGVRLFGDFAENAATSIRRGDPVVVTGRFALEAWENEERSGASLVLYAIGMGHDLSRGKTTFTRVIRGQDMSGTRAATQGAHSATSDRGNNSDERPGTADASEFERAPAAGEEPDEEADASMAVTA